MTRSPAPLPARPPHWRKSSHSGSEGGECVEVAVLPRGVAVRDSKAPGGPAVVIAPAAWTSFVDFATAPPGA